MATATPTPTEDASKAGGGALGGGGGGKSDKIVLALSVVNLLVTLGMMGVLFLSFQREKNKPTVEDIAAHPGGGGEGEGDKSHGKAEGGHGGGEGGEGHAKPMPATHTFGKMIALDQFTINLSTPGSVSPKYVKMNISVELPNDEVETEVNSKMPQVRNVIIDLVNSKRVSDLATAESRDLLKEEIRNAINSFMVTGKIKGVFFTSFAIAG